MGCSQHATKQMPNEENRKYPEPPIQLTYNEQEVPINKAKLQIISKINVVMQSEELNSVWSLIETEDKRIASGSAVGDISISSYNITEKKWKRDIHKEHAHDDSIHSLCSLNSNRLISGSNDLSIKVWTISNVDITLIKEIKEHAHWVCMVIPLTKERFASCSCDKTVKIWNSNETYKCLATLTHVDEVRSILQLKGKEVLVSCGQISSTGLSFWNLTNYTRQYTIKGYDVCLPTHMIELSDGNIALSFFDKPCSIVIIDSSSYQIRKDIQLKEHITFPSSLCVLNEHSFIYVCNGTLIQISNEDYSILYQLKGQNFNGDYGIIPLQGGKYFAIQNDTKISIIKPYYD